MPHILYYIFWSPPHTVGHPGSEGVRPGIMTELTFFEKERAGIRHRKAMGLSRIPHSIIIKIVRMW